MRRTLIGLTVLAFLAVACGSTASLPSATPGAGTPAASGTPASSPVGGGTTVELASSELGEILVDGDGLTLYGFVPDQAAGGTPTCYDACAQNWPALEADDSFSVGDGLDSAGFSVVERTDGSSQLVVGDYPLYYFANDTAAGDTNGQGVGGSWFVVGADGELIQ